MSKNILFSLKKKWKKYYFGWADAHGGHLWQNVTSFNNISYFTVLTYEAKNIKHEPLKY